MIRVVLIFLLLIEVSGCNRAEEQKQAPNKPNIIVIVADDLGYADLGCYGGIIETPNLDKLAARGTQFTNFHTAPTCAPTRAMLLTGNDNHIAGMGIQGETMEEWGYEGHLTDRVVTIPQVLKKAGYHTFIAGKWHLGEKPENNPHQKGFDRSFVMLQGAGNHSNDISVLGIGDSLQLSDYTEDGKPASWPEGAYSTTYYTDRIIGYIEDNLQANRPFFALATYTSPHWPLQVDSIYWQKYKGRFDQGYEQWRLDNLDRLIKKGFLPEGTKVPQLNPNVTPWDSLSQGEQQIEVRKMELYAGMVDQLDVQIGRLMEYLTSINALDNTRIIFMSDNGAAAEDFFYKGPFVDHSQKYFNNDFDNMGKPDSYVSYGPQWAEAGTASFRDHKGYTREGGVLAPMIIAGYGIPTGMVTNAFASVLDLAPTIYDWAGTTYPLDYDDIRRYPLRGETMEDFFSGYQSFIHDSTYVFAVEQSGDMLVRKGDWKLVNEGYPIEEDRFELYNLNMDITESEDLSKVYPAERAELIALWREYRDQSKIKLDKF